MIENQEVISVITTEDEATLIQHPETTTSVRYDLLTEYECLIADTRRDILLPKQHDKWQRMHEIGEAIQKVSFALKELELIQQAKEADFCCRRH